MEVSSKKFHLGVPHGILTYSYRKKCFFFKEVELYCPKKKSTIKEFDL